MSGARQYDIGIIGGGILGLSSAMQLARQRPSKSIVLLEAEPRLSHHQTGRNSGVIHAGLYYKPGSLKARNCVEGRQTLYRFCEEHGIPYERCGKLVVATCEGEIPRLKELKQRGRANGLTDLRSLPAEELREIEPHAAGLAGLFVPDTGIVDFTLVAGMYAILFREAGGEIMLGARVEGFQREAGGMVLETTRGDVRCRCLINCSGLYCDRIARLCGVEPGIRIVPFRGEYYELVEERRSLVKNLIYPIPDPKFPFLGVHFTRMINGGIEAGPNAVLALSREGYRKKDISARDMMETLGYGGFWKMALQYWRMGAGEMYRSLSKRAFVRALQRLVPALRKDDIQRAGAGVRAQALAPDGRLLDDFHILESEGMIHVLNAPSPAATASLCIGKHIADSALRDFNLNGKARA